MPLQPALAGARRPAAITWYTEGGWRLDRAGEELLRNLDYPTPELLGLIGPLRAAYRARWENTLLRWSETWAAAGCPLPALGTAGDWLAAVLHAGPRATAILIADALRYDLAAGLAQRVNGLEGAERATVRPARAPLPSTTALGMPLALPIAGDDLEANLVAGKWQVRRRDHAENLSLAAERRDLVAGRGPGGARCFAGPGHGSPWSDPFTGARTWPPGDLRRCYRHLGSRR